MPRGLRVTPSLQGPVRAFFEAEESRPEILLDGETLTEADGEDGGGAHASKDSGATRPAAGGAGAFGR